MRALIAGLLAFLLILSGVARLLRPSRLPPGVTPLVWASSKNPYRYGQIDYFNATHPGLRLRLDGGNADFQRIIVQTCSGVGPDVFDVLKGSYLQAYVEAGVAWDLTAAAAADGIAADRDAWPAVHNEITYEGRQYGYPAGVGCFLILYNKNVFDRRGVPYPTDGMTWEEFLQRLTRVSGVLPDGSRIWGTNAVDYAGTAPAAFFWKAVFYSRHGEFFSPDGTRPTIDTPDLRVALQLHQDAIVRYRVLPRTVDVGAGTGQGGWGNPATTQFAEGHYATIVSGKFALASLRGFVEMQKRDLARWEADPARQRTEPRPEVLRLGVARLPHASGRPFACVALSQTVVINPASPHRAQALAFLRFLASDAYAQRVESYGIPGNPRLARTDYPVTDPELAEHEITRCEVESLRDGYQTRKSPFLLDFDVDRALDAQVARLEADPSLDCGRLLAEAQGELEAMLRLNLSRDPRLAAEYHRRIGAGALTSNP